MWAATFFAALSAFLLSMGLVRHLNRAHQKLMETERLKARVGLENHYSQVLQEDARCSWCELGKLLGPKSVKELHKIKQHLIRAGFRHETHLGIYLLIKFGFVLLVGLVSVSAWSWGLMRWEWGAFATVLSVLLPERVLIQLGNHRLQKVTHALPDFLDMANICMSAGLSYLVAIQRVVDEFEDIYPEIAFEFHYFLDQVQIGVPRYEALQQLAERNPSDEMQELVQVLTQNEKLGSPIGVAMNEFARRMYQKREQTMEEKAAKTSAKMAIIILPFLMIPYFVLLLGERMVMLARSW